MISTRGSCIADGESFDGSAADFIDKISPNETKPGLVNDVKRRGFLAESLFDSFERKVRRNQFSCLASTADDASVAIVLNLRRVCDAFLFSRFHRT